jgi:ABC-type branched-subunit amino acid transport system substrate-binding protein
VADALRRAQSLDKEILRKALADTDLDTIGGHIKFNDKNVAATPVGIIQWLKGKKFPFICKIVSGGIYKEITPEAKLLSIQELQGKS